MHCWLADRCTMGRGGGVVRSEGRGRTVHANILWHVPSTHGQERVSGALLAGLLIILREFSVDGSLRQRAEQQRATEAHDRACHGGSVGLCLSFAFGSPLLPSLVVSFVHKPVPLEN